MDSVFQDRKVPLVFGISGVGIDGRDIQVWDEFKNAWREPATVERVKHLIQALEDAVAYLEK